MDVKFCFTTGLVYPSNTRSILATTKPTRTVCSGITLTARGEHINFAIGHNHLKHFVENKSNNAPQISANNCCSFKDQSWRVIKMCD